MFTLLVLVVCLSTRPNGGSKKELVVLDSREVAPLAAHIDMYYNYSKVQPIGNAVLQVLM